MESFKELGLRPEILEALNDLGFEKPTPIQAKAIPTLIAENRDMIASAQTGTGKTAAFGLPAVHLTDVKNKEVQTLILCPTRELCLQITRDLMAFAKHDKGLNVVAVYGGANISTQIKELRNGAQIVVATPGRAIDLIKRRKLILDSVERLILDEADEMLNMGFKDDLDTILEVTPATRQTLLFSATMSSRIKSITKKYMDNPVELAAARVNMAAANVKHICYTVLTKNRYEVLKRIADLNPDIYGIVFCRTRRETQEVAQKLQADGYNADSLHGDLSQAQRDEAMGRFRKGILQILVATDVASRGLDVNDLTHVINFNLPDDPEVYIHRSGRTGRAGKDGISIAVITNREQRRIRDIERISNLTFEYADVPTGKDICTKQLLALIDRVQDVKVNNDQIEPFLPAIYEKLEGLDREQLIKHFISAEFNRFLDYYKNARDINVKAGSSRKERSERPERGESGGRGRSRGDMGRLYLNVGNKNRLTVPRLIGLINDTLDSNTAAIGKIDIQKSFTFFEIEKDVIKELVSGMKLKKFDGNALLPEIAAAATPEEKERSERSSGGSGRFNRGDRDKNKPRGYKKSKRRTGDSSGRDQKRRRRD